MAELRVIAGRRSLDARFEALLQPHYELLYRTAYRLTRSVPDAEDLAQEVCVRAFPRLDELQQLDDPRAWLLCVMRRLFIDQTRRYERRFVDSLETTDQMLLAAREPGPAEEAERAIDARHLDLAWTHLDAGARVLLALHDIEGYSLAEMKEITGINEGTLKSRLHRARAKLGKLLQRQTVVNQFRARTGVGS
jgi:RNA polymerase sigma-70 factor (ECF subfamily)